MRHHDIARVLLRSECKISCLRNIAYATGYSRRAQMLKVDAEALLKEKEDALRALETYKLMHAYEAAATPLR